VLGVWSNATDGWDYGLDYVGGCSTYGCAAVYHEHATPEWLGQTGFYKIDRRAPLARDERKTWEPLCVWAPPYYTSGYINVTFQPDTLRCRDDGAPAALPPADRTFLLELTRVPEDVTSGAPPIGSVWELSHMSPLILSLPVHRTSDGLTGYHFSFTVTEAEPEPGDLDNDGDVDEDDFQAFSVCLSGPAGDGGTVCDPERLDRSDEDNDGDVDLSDYSALALHYTGLLTSRPTYAGAATCVECHETYHTDWSGTRHAGAFNTLVEDGEADNPACYPCHTLGFGSPSGFLDIETTPHLANVQCENCHGPGSQHNIDPARVPLSVDLDSNLCGQCHQSCHGMCGDYYHPHFEQWSTSKHAQALSEIRWLPEYEESCLPCHATDYRLAPADDKPGIREVLFSLECVVCHRPYGSPNVSQLRLPPEKLCAQCHTMGDAAPRVEPDRPHVEFLHGVGGYALDGTPLPPVYSIPYMGVPGECAGCHVVREDYTGPDQAANSGHTFESNFLACELCHGPGEGEVRLATVRAEIEPRLTALSRYLDPADPLYVNPATLTSEQLDQYYIARFDYEFVAADGSYGGHNAAFARVLLTEAETFFESVP
jgi:predicted CXXCH cytochrome family protein